MTTPQAQSLAKEKLPMQLGYKKNPNCGPHLHKVFFLASFSSWCQTFPRGRGTQESSRASEASATLFSVSLPLCVYKTQGERLPRLPVTSNPHSYEVFLALTRATDLSWPSSSRSDSSPPHCWDNPVHPRGFIPRQFQPKCAAGLNVQEPLSAYSSSPRQHS